MQHNTTMSRPARNPSATDELQTRRNVLRFGMSSLVGLRCLTGASAGACPQLQDSENDHLLLGFSTYGMKTLTTESAISHIARIGFDSAEITVWPDWDAAPGNMTVERRQTIKTQLADSGLRLTSLMEHITPSEKDTQHAAQRTRLAGVFELAADLCPAQRPLVQTVLGGGQWEKKRELLRDRVGDWLDLATAHKTVLAIKPHRGGVVSRPEEAVWLIEQLGQSRYLRIVYDYSHYAYRDMLLADTVRTALPYLAHVAVKDAVKEGNRIVFKLPGQAGTIPYAKLLKLLFDGGYRGDISCEVSSMVWNKPGYAPVAAAEACYRSLAKAFVEADVRRPA
jgi:inosose dehydratase